MKFHIMDAEPYGKVIHNQVDLGDDEIPTMIVPIAICLCLFVDS